MQIKILPFTVFVWGIPWETRTNHSVHHLIPFSFSLSAAHHLPLALIALLIFPLTRGYEKRGWRIREKKQYKLSKSHWPTSADVSLGIHISAEELGAEIPPHLHHFSRHPLLFLFQLEAIFLHIPCLILCYHDSALCKWINALLWRNQSFLGGALSPLLTAAEEAWHWHFERHRLLLMNLAAQTRLRRLNIARPWDRKWNYDRPIQSTNMARQSRSRKRERQLKSFFLLSPSLWDCGWPC